MEKYKSSSSHHQPDLQGQLNVHQFSAANTQQSRVSRDESEAPAVTASPQLHAPRPSTVLVQQHPSAATNMSPAAELASHFARAFRGPGVSGKGLIGIPKRRWNMSECRVCTRHTSSISWSGIGFLGPWDGIGSDPFRISQCHARWPM